MNGFEMIKEAAKHIECKTLMGKIYASDPSHWPYGLSPEQHDDLCLIRKQASGECVGFTGWQSRKDPDGSRVGYYTIGVLPEYQRQGFAKQAVAAMIERHKGSVDTVRAAIVPGNSPSFNLARSLGVPIQTSF